MKKTSLFSSVAALALADLAITPVLAQDVEEIDERRDTIVVTARKTEENIQDVPVSVTAFGSEDIFEQGIQNIEDISRRTAGFIFDTPFGRQFDRPIIRGQANILGASGVSVFIDGVNVPQSIRSLNFGDVDRIEIIKGPQSALFGRNTYSGAINITTRQPTNEIGGEVSFEAGADGLYQFLGNLRGPIIEDKLYFSLAGRIYEFQSEFDVPSNENPSIGNESSRSIAGVIKAYPTENWEVTFRGAYNQDDDGHFPIGLLTFPDLNVNVPGGFQAGGTQPFFQGVVPPSFPTPNGSGQLSNTLGEGGGIEREDQFFSLNSNFEFGGGYNLFTTVGYTKETFRDELDSDGQLDAFGNGFIFSFPVAGGAGIGVGLVSPFDFTTTDDDEQETFVAEARIDSPADAAFRWRLGGYYFKSVDRNRDLLGRFEDGTFNAIAEQSFNDAVSAVQSAAGAFFSFPAVPFGGLNPANPRNTTINNYAVFGSAAYDLTDRLTANAELRWQQEDINELELAQATNAVLRDSDRTFVTFTPRFTLDYQLTDDNLLFANAARGTKPGGFNNLASENAGFGSFDEETAWQFEIGSKNTFANGQVLLNLAGFFTALQDYQLTQSLSALGVPGTTASATANLGDVNIFGIELEGSLTPDAIPGLTIGGNYAYTNAEFTNGQELTQGNVFGNDDLTGQRLPRQTPHQAAFFVDYSTPVSERVEALFSVNGNYLGSRFSQVQNLAESGSSFEVDARITLTLDDSYSLSFYGKNLTNEDAVNGVLRFLDPIGGNGSLLINGVAPAGVFDLRGATQSRGFQFNNRLGPRWGVVLRATF